MATWKRVALIVSTAIACSHGSSRQRPVGPAPDWVDTPSGRIRVDAGGTGSGVPVLLVHGLGMNRAMWRAQVQHLRASRPAAAFDLPGFGQSDPPSDGDYSLAAGVRSIAVVADALGYDRFVLVGHSYSGLLAGKYAAEHHDRIAGVVLTDGAFDPSTWPAGAIETTVRGMRQNWSAAIEKAFTPFILQNLRTVDVRVQAAEPLGNFSANPWPPGPAPYIP